MAEIPATLDFHNTTPGRNYLLSTLGGALLRTFEEGPGRVEGEDMRHMSELSLGSTGDT
jgi:hypothetical protein